MVERGKPMARIRSKELRSQFVTPLSALLTRLTTAAQELEKLEDAGEIPFLPANYTEALRALGQLEVWAAREIESKLDGVNKGSAKIKAAIRNEKRKEKQEGKSQVN